MVTRVRLSLWLWNTALGEWMGVTWKQVNSIHGVSSLQVVTQARACVVVSSPSPEVFKQKLESPGQNSG